MTITVGVLASNDWVGPGREYLIIVSGPDISHGIILSSLLRLWMVHHYAFIGLGLKHNQGQDVIFSLTETVLLINRPETLDVQ